MMNTIEFERVVAQAMDEFPPNIRRQIVNVVIVVEDMADDVTLDMVQVDDPMSLLGFYNGVPLTGRTQNYGLVPPDKISIYREPILALCRNDAEVIARVRTTLRHEIAHYFGISDERLMEMGAY